MDDTVPPKRIKRLLREFAAKAHEEELRRALTPLANAFERWSRGEVDSFELSDLIHAFHQGPSRDLFVRYTSRPHDPAVTYAIATGIIDRRDLPDELLEHLARALEHAPAEVLEAGVRSQAVDGVEAREGGHEDNPRAERRPGRWS